MSDDLARDLKCSQIVGESNAVLVASTARCQISDESKDEDMPEKEKKPKKTNKADKTTPSLASLNSNYRDDSSGSDSNDRVGHHTLFSVLSKTPILITDDAFI